MSTTFVLLNALGKEIDWLAKQRELNRRFAGEVEQGKQSAALLRDGMSKREALRWTEGAEYATAEIHGRLQALYDLHERLCRKVK